MVGEPPCTSPDGRIFPGAASGAGMRVAVVAYDVFLAERQGLDRVLATAEALADRGHEVAVFCTQWWEGYDTRRARNGVEYRAVTVDPAFTSFVARLPALLVAYGPDAVHATPRPPASVLAARAGATLSRARLVLDWYGDESVDGAGVLRPAARSPDAVVCPSRYVETRVRAAGVPDDRTRVIPEFVDVSRVLNVETRVDGPEVVAARRLDEDANLESLFLALAELRRRDWSCVVFGDGPMRAAAEEEAADLRIDDRVEFAGRVSFEERLATYRGAHVFVHTATREYFATELLWALAAGCVGVVEYQKESGAHELVERRERGFRATEPEEIAEAIVDAGSLAARSVDESIAETFGEDAVVERFLDCYAGR